MAVEVIIVVNSPLRQSENYDRIPNLVAAFKSPKKYEKV